MLSRQLKRKYINIKQVPTYFSKKFIVETLVVIKVTEQSSNDFLSTMMRKRVYCFYFGNSFPKNWLKSYKD